MKLERSRGHRKMWEMPGAGTNGRLRVLVFLTIAVAVTLLSPGQASAQKMGYSAVNDYTSGPLDCQYGSLVKPKPFIQNFFNTIATGNPAYYWWTNDYVLDTKLKSATEGPNYVNMWMYAGHGYDLTYGQQGGSSLHLYARSASTKYHGISNEYTSDTNTVWDELRLGHHGTTEELKWFVTYSCNFLRNGGSQYNVDRQGYMFEGLHQVLGFASIMYVYADVGTLFAQRINNGYSVLNAWHLANDAWQPAGVVTRVYGHYHTFSDSFFAFNTRT